MQHDPVTGAITMHEYFPTCSCVYHHARDSELGAHAPKIRGCSTEAGEVSWLVANSWTGQRHDHGAAASSTLRSYCDSFSRVSLTMISVALSNCHDEIQHCTVQCVSIRWVLTRSKCSTACSGLFTTSSLPRVLSGLTFGPTRIRSMGNTFYLSLHRTTPHDHSQEEG